MLELMSLGGMRVGEALKIRPISIQNATGHVVAEMRAKKQDDVGDII